MTASVVTDRTAIADVIATGLNELDTLRSLQAEADKRVTDAQVVAANAADAYASKIEEVLATGWATAEGLAAQGHQIPKGRRAKARTAPAEPSAADK